MKKLTDNIYYDKVLGEGGNAFVYDAEYKKQKGFAAKILKKEVQEKNKDRFSIEICQVRKIQQSVAGIVPILEYCFSAEECWYLMPRATPILDYIGLQKKSKPLELNCVKIKVTAILELAKVLSELHKKDIHHRDIKPSNLYFYKEKFCFADFGLVDCPDKQDLTSSNDRVGPQGFLPPEMCSNTKGVDFKKVDVYELAKTLWVVLTEKKEVFQGRYDEEDTSIGISYQFKKLHHLVELEELLLKSTQINPSLRPSIDEFVELLEKWFLTIDDLEKRNISQWNSIVTKLFPKAFPETSSFEKTDEIIYILNMISRLPGINHMFFPDGGGLDLTHAKKSAEINCIELNCGGAARILKPKRLLIENIKDDPHWSYIRLEVDDLDPHSSPRDFEESDHKKICEKLTEITPGEYGDWILGNYRKYSDGTPLPEGSRIVNRYLSRCSFVIFLKNSRYNKTPATYDARHNKFSTDEFRALVKLMRLFAGISPEIYSKYFNKKIKSFKYFLKDNFSKNVEEQEKNPLAHRKSAEFSAYISSNLETFDFSEICSKFNKELDMPSYFHLRLEKSCIDLLDSNDAFEKKYLAKEGKIKTIMGPCFDKNSPPDALLFSTHDASLSAAIEIKNLIQKQCEESGHAWFEGSEDEICLKSYMNRNIDIKPTHLFTREEINATLRNGDDSENNVLVVDHYGHSHLKNPYAHPNQYPVKHETYCAYNNYVGSFSNLNHAEDVYLNSLFSWLKYLKTKESQYCDLHGHSHDEKKLIEEINKFY